MLRGTGNLKCAQAVAADRHDRVYGVLGEFVLILVETVAIPVDSIEGLLVSERCRLCSCSEPAG